MVFLERLHALFKHALRRLSGAQIGLTVIIALLVLVVAVLITVTYLNINTATAFQASYAITDLANLRSDIIRLHVETNRVLRDRSSNFTTLENLRSNLRTQMQIALAEASNNPRVTATLTEMQYTLDQ